MISLLQHLRLLKFPAKLSTRQNLAVVHSHITLERLSASNGKIDDILMESDDEASMLVARGAPGIEPEASRPDGRVLQAKTHPHGPEFGLAPQWGQEH